jgi:pectin methylesterase-like acyl-CoA thioesterase
MANLTLHDTTPQGGSQAEAIILTGNANTAHFILTNCDLYSYQDTLQINGQAYISDCYIVGDVDFMWGTGPCFFENCRATSVRPNGYFSQIRNTAANHGYVYKDCTFDGNPGITGNVFSRIAPAQFPASEVVLLNCLVTSAVGDAGWRFDGNAPADAGTTHFWEYKSHDASGKPVDVSKRFAASKQLTDEADAEAIKNYGNPTWVLGGQWTPDLGPILKQIKEIRP